MSDKQPPSEENGEEKEKKVIKEEIQEEIRKPMVIFQFNDQLGEFEELEFEQDIELVELLDPDFVLLFVDPKHFRVWIWHGSNTTTRMKFIAAKIAPTIRDRYGIRFKITAVDESNETLNFKVMMGLEKEIDYAEVYSPFPNQELMWLERLGLFEENTAHLRYRDGTTAPNGDLPVNCSGGVNSTNAIGASGLERVAEAALQIMGKASNQVPKTVHSAIGHGWGGCINFVTLSVLSDQPKRKWRGI